MDRPSQEPAAQPDGAESPLSFPVEAPRPTGPEPGAGAPQAEPLNFPAEIARPPLAGSESGAPQAEPLNFPAEASRAALAGSEPGSPQGEPLRFPADAPRPPLAGSESGAPQAEPLRFPADAPPPAQPPLFPGDAAPAPGPPLPGPPPTELPYPVAHIPGAVPNAGPLPPAAGPPTTAAEPPASAPPPSFSLLRFAPPALALVAAVMTALGAFLPLFRIREHLGAGQRFLDTQILITETAWGHTYELPDQGVTDQPGAPAGIPLLFAVVLFVAAALVVFTRPDHRLGRWLISAGAVFAAGVVATVGTSGIGWAATARGDDLTVAIGPGMWLLAGGTIAAAAAAVLAYLPRHQPSWADPALAYTDTPTPPSGVAITVLPPDLPDAPHAPEIPGDGRS
ncbi:hypothetical protein ACWED2_46840 [Amycolatopsis sp. NPDC005003]